MLLPGDVSSSGMINYVQQGFTIRIQISDGPSSDIKDIVNHGGGIYITTYPYVADLSGRVTPE